MTHEEYEKARAIAAELGRENGEAAASWYFDGNTTAETYRRVLKGINDGDPEITDTLPSNPLSGEFAGDMTPAYLFNLVLGTDDAAYDEEAELLCEAYVEAYEKAAHDRIQLTCQQNLPETNYGEW